VSSIESDFRAPRGAGSLTEVECGLLEYVSLALSEAIARHRNDVGRWGTINRFLNAQEISTITRDETAHYRFFQCPVSLGMHIGRLLIGVPPMSDSIEVPVDVLSPAQELALPLPDQIELRLALRPVAISREEATAMSVGDVLLTGYMSLQADGNMELVTSNGWRIFGAEIISDSPTVAQIKLSDCALRPWAGMTCNAPNTYWPTIASIALAPSAIATLHAGSLVDLPRRAGDLVLWTDGAAAWRGELVRVQGELAVRLLSRYE
jgi:hypothetical protein